MSTISITKQSLGATEADILTRALLDMKGSESVTMLDLSGNKLTYRAIDALLPGLSHLKGLKKLDLSQNLFYREGAESLASYLDTNKTLTSLRMTECDICNGGHSMGGPEALSIALTRNKHLTELDLSGNKVPDRFLIRIKDSLSVNRSLLYDGHSELERMILAKLPPVPVFDHPPDKNYKIPEFDEMWLRKERYVFRDFIIEPEVEVVEVVKKKKKGGKEASVRDSVAQRAKDLSNILMRGGKGVMGGGRGGNAKSSDRTGAKAPKR